MVRMPINVDTSLELRAVQAEAASFIADPPFGDAESLRFAIRSQNVKCRREESRDRGSFVADVAASVGINLTLVGADRVR